MSIASTSTAEVGTVSVVVTTTTKPPAPPKPARTF